MKRITSITIAREPDTTSTPDYLGTYSESPADNAIDRKEQGDWQRGQLRYFNPIGDYPSEHTGHQQEAREWNYKRAEAFNNSDWSFIGVRAVATVETSEDGKTWLSNQLGSMGYGVSSPIAMRNTWPVSGRKTRHVNRGSPGIRF